MNGADTVARIAALTDKWLLTDTHDRLVDANLTDSPANHLCLSVIPVAHTYCRAILDLADKEYVLPAMALTRVLAEITHRTIWCLGETEEEPEVKIERWLKRSYIKRRDLLKDMVESEMVPDADKGQFNHDIDELTKYIDGISHTTSGSVTKSVTELPILKELYTHLYCTMHCAIHPDLIVLGDTIRQEGDEQFSVGDWTHIPKTALARNCLHLAFQLTVHVQTFQELDTGGTKAEYDEAVKFCDG